MWKVVLWLSVVAAAEAFKGPYIEYLYSRKNGQVHIKPILFPASRSDELNKTIYITNDDPDLLQNETMHYLRQLTQTRDPRFQKWNSAAHFGAPPYQKKLRGNNKLKSLHGQKKPYRSKRLHVLKKLHGPKKLHEKKRLSAPKKHRVANIRPHNRINLNGKHMTLNGGFSRKDPQLEKLQSAVKPAEVKECTDGPVMFHECNHCVCVGGQLYVCTARVCEPGDRSSLIAFEKDTNCIEGEQIRSFDDCNRCYCGGGQILCTRKNCPKRADNEVRDWHGPKCSPGTNIPSPDSCNFCACNTKGFIVCTTRSCGPEISPDIKDMGCKPNTWYSLERDSRCKECYCINGKMSFCYVNLCQSHEHMALSNKKKKKKKHLDLPGALPDHCDVDDYMQDRCTKCYCSMKGIWSCKTREIGKCGRQTPDAWASGENKVKDRTAKPTKSRKTRKRTRKRKTTQTPIMTTDYIDDTQHFSDFPNYTNYYAPSETPGVHTSESTIYEGITTIYPEYEMPYYKDDPNRIPSTEYPYTNEENTVYPDYEISTPSYYSDTSIYSAFNNSDEWSDPTTMFAETTPTDGHTSFDYGQGTETTIEDCEYDDTTSYDSRPDTTKKLPVHTYTTHSVVEDFGITSDTSSITISSEHFDIPEMPDMQGLPDNPNSPEVAILPPDSNIDKGPFCANGQFFTQGSDTHCQGCFCTMNNEWKCYSIKGSCRAEKNCNAGKLKKVRKPCSICYCGVDNRSYCATDETCSYSIKPSMCEAVSCLNHCHGEGANFGICHNDSCVCVN